MVNSVRKDIWINSYPIFLWLALEPIVGLIDSKIASVINLDTLSAIGIGETIYFVFIWVFIFLAYGTTPLVSSLNTKNEINKLNYFIKFGRNVSILLGLGSFLILINGILMGTANKIPGVSGGLVAIAIGFYEELVFSLKKIDNKALKFLFSGKLITFYNHINGHFLFLILLGIVNWAWKKHFLNNIN